MPTDTSSCVPDFDSLTVPANRLAPVVQRYLIDRRTLERKYPIRHSEACQTRICRFYLDWLNAIGELDFESLGTEERIDFVMFQNHLRFVLSQMASRSARDAEMAALVPFKAAVAALEDARRAMEWANPEEVAAQLSAITSAVTDTQQLLCQNGSEAASVWKRTTANRAVEAIGTLRDVLRDWYTFYDGFDPQFTWWNETPYLAADKALESYRDCLATSLVKTDATDTADIIGDPIGSDALSAELAFEMIPYSAEELIGIAEQELVWCEAEMAAAAAELGFSSDTRAAVEHVKRLHAAPGNQPELVKRLALEAIDYLDEYDLVTIPPLAREAWRLEMMSAEKQKVNPFFLGGEVIQVSFPTDTMTHDEKLMSMRGNNIHFSRATVQHELIPGHHLQGFMQERSRTYRRPFGTPFWIEGWTIYWEFLLYLKGFPQCAEDRIGMLFWRMHRCVRVIFSLSFHLEKMSPQECIEMLVERVGHERANAEAEVRRSCGDVYPPLYQCAYLIGGLQVWALRQELVESGRMDEKSFHDAVVSQNSIPIEMVRAALTCQDLPKDFKSSWRFYDDIKGQAQ